MEAIQCRVVRTHNLKGFDVSFPLGQWIAVTGVSGSGKSSLVFDTLFAESQRRFLETLGTYERQFLQGLPQGDFESIDNVPAAIALKQSNSSSDPRSVIATSADILQPLIAVFSAFMEPSCGQCGSDVQIDRQENVFSFLDSVKAKDGVALVVSLKITSIEEMIKSLKTVVAEGFIRVLYNNKPMMIEDFIGNNKNLKKITGPLYLILDRIHKESDIDELKNRVDQAWSQIRFSSQFRSLEAISLSDPDIKKQFYVFPYCTHCKKTTKLIEPGHLDWTSAMGACRKCQGIGNVPLLDASKIIPDATKTLVEGAIKTWSTPTFQKWTDALIKELNLAKVDHHIPYSQLDDGVKKWIWDGEDPLGRLKSGGSASTSLNAFFQVLEAESYKPQNRILLSKYRSYWECSECQGTRLSEPGRKAVYDKEFFASLFNQEIRVTYQWILNIQKKEHRSARWEQIRYYVEEALKKLSLLNKLGLGSAHLGRRCRTLSGGEYQRVLLSKVLGNGLSDALYVLDEPSVGLGALEVRELIPCLKELRDQGNTIIMVEHDPLLVKAADIIIELGPGGGALGGHLLPSSQTPQSLIPDKNSMKFIICPPRMSVELKKTLSFAQGSLELKNFSQHNCQNVYVQCPLGCLTVISGPSGAGKSTLIEHGLLPALELYEKQGIISQSKITDTMGTWELLSLPHHFLETHQIVSVEQKALSKSISSVVATVLGVMNSLRDLFVNCDDAKRRGLVASHFSFNSAGACPECLGRGTISDDLFFLGEVEKVCPECEGTRFNWNSRQVLLGDKSINKWMSCDIETFINEFPIKNKFSDKLHLALLLGLGHLSLGTCTTELSGGEAQRLRLAAALGKSKKKLFCVIDEPTRGLSEKDVSQLLKVFHDLCDKGNTFVIVEHHELFKEHAHQLYTMGPGGGLDGGQVTHREVCHAP